MSAPSLGAAAALGGRAALRSGWLAAVGLLVALARRALGAPATAVAGTLVAAGAFEAAGANPFSVAAPIAGALAVLGSPRFVGLVVGLWLAGSLLGAALRAVYLAGALPTLGGALAGEAQPPPRFASGIAWGFPRVAGAALLGWVLDLTGGLFAGTLALAAFRVGFGGQATGAVGFAAAAAAALVVGVAVALALSVTADAAVARAALRGEGPAHAVAAAAGRLLARPGTFLLAGLAFGALGAVAAGGVRSIGGIATGFASDLDPMLLAGPELMVAVAGALVAAFLDLWWLGTIAVLAGSEER